MSAGTLFVVATPIGNLEDITLRALRVLREAHLIAAEDTRRTAKLLAHHAIPTPTVSFHAHNVRRRLPQLIGQLEAGRNIALVTDAGTPGVSDPGSELVSACVKTGIPVDAIPGPCAPLTAALASGFPVTPLTILGFPPRRAQDRNRWYQAISSLDGTITFFEAPHRIRRTLTEIGHVLGERQIMIGRELTKVHQEFLFGPAGTLCQQIGDPRGEFTVVVGPADRTAIVDQASVSDSTVADLFGHITETVGSSRRSAIGEVAERLGLPRKQVYAAVERAKKAGQ